MFTYNARFLNIVAFHPQRALMLPQFSLAPPPNSDLAFYSRIGEVVEHFAPDWIQYATNAWLVWSRAEAKIWAQRVKAVTTDQLLSVLVSELRIEGEHSMFGFQSDQFWKWLNTNRSMELVINEDVLDVMHPRLSWGPPQF